MGDWTEVTNGAPELYVREELISNVTYELYVYDPITQKPQGTRTVGASHHPTWPPRREPPRYPGRMVNRRVSGIHVCCVKVQRIAIWMLMTELE